ncbi:sulfatase-like hydrolase/transferase [Niameybacter massiliensis]|uniref:Sulfatase-like hydrolase/transferase n=1 Tax=Holtiella tumoricola TaxID=3018743 RepID=A0AA42DL19_9FIRM|nr:MULTISPECIES: sulfatase-like hydrolase/transferase [Lachnospirales]MDA3730884.1 sulfatase-like hydrolase/transferase [Holtiella tumoricola]
MEGNIRKVVFIMTDSQRKDMVGCYGNPHMRTPNIDRLAEEGIRFEKAYTAQPVCQPARAGLFTGQYPRSTGGWTNSMGIGQDVQHIGQRLNDHGIHTAFIGKWHLDGGDYFGMGRCPEGWDKEYWYDMRNYLEELTPEERVLSRDQNIIFKQGVEEAFTYGHRCSNRAVDFLEKHHDEDFFLVVSYDEPHQPFLAPTHYAESYNDYFIPITEGHYDTLENKPQHHKVWAGLKKDQARRSEEAITNQTKSGKLGRDPIYFGCNSFADAQIGRVVDAVKKHAPDALIIYTSDHGIFFGEHGLWCKGPAMYDEITNIPLIMSCKQWEEKGIVDNNPVSHIDLAPTIFEFMGVPIPKMFMGSSIKDQILTKKRVKDYVFMEFGRYEVDHDGFGGMQLIRAIFDGRHKLVLNLLTSDELYDLEKDPSEINNLIEDEAYKEIRNKLHNALLDEMNRSRDPFRGYYWENRSWREDATEPTWDYTGMTRQKENEEYEPRQLDYMTGLEMAQAVRGK